MRDDAFRAYFDRHHVELSRLAYLMTGDVAGADDLAAAALAGVRRDGKPSDAVAYGRGLLLRLTRRAAPGGGPGVLGALGRLPWRLRACVVLRHALDLSDTEIAAALGIPARLARWRAARGTRRLTALLGAAPAAAHRLIGDGEAAR